MKGLLTEIQDNHNKLYLKKGGPVTKNKAIDLTKNKAIEDRYQIKLKENFYINKAIDLTELNENF